MTDRLHSCKQSPDGRHHYTARSEIVSVWRFTCRFCGSDRPDAVVVTPAGWNVPAHDPDAHLGGVGE